MVSDTNASFSNDIYLGCRIECGEHYGTVRYIGEVDGYMSAWVGVDWDDPTRGKHDGSVAGKRYFQASSETSGSFVRPGKIQAGKNAVRAVRSRYGKKEDQTEAQMNQLQLLNVQREINAPFLQMVGFDQIKLRQSNFQDLRVVCLRMQFVNGPGPEDELLKTCPNIHELDLSKNLINNWTDIFTICKQLKNLRWLNISENILEMPQDTSDISFPIIKTLICGYMKLKWNDVLQIANIFTNVEEFRLPYNLISNIDIPSEHNFHFLKLFDIEGNALTDSSDINKLGILESLEQLFISNSSLRYIKFDDCVPGEKLNIFTKLKQLVISENIIDNWETICELNKLQCLEDLRFLKNPILETENPATCFQLIVARISTLNILNGTLIKPEDRKGAEYDYIKKQGLEWLEASKNKEKKKEFLLRHPRYLELIGKHGSLEEAELLIKSQTLKTNLIDIQIKCRDLVVSKKLPVSMTLQKLIMLVQKLFKLDERPVLYYVSIKQPDMHIEMDDEFKDIGYYALQDGDIIYVK